MTETTSVTEGGITVTSTSESAEQIREAIAEPSKPDEAERDPISQAASELGKRGAEAKRAKAANDASDGASIKPERSAYQAADEPSGTESGAKPLGKPRDDPRARMLEATRKEAEAKRERDSARAEAEAARRERDELKARLEAPKVSERAEAADGEPVLADYGDDTVAYVKAYSKWEAANAVKEYRAQLEQDTKAREFYGAVDVALGEAINYRKEYAKTDPGFEERISPEVKAIIPKLSRMRDMNEKLQSDHVIADELLNLRDVAPKMMLHLSEHPEDLERIRSMNDWPEIQVEMRVLAKTLNGSPAPAQKGAVSQAKPPVRPVNGSSHVSDSVPGEDATYDQHKAYWTKRERDKMLSR